MDYILFELCAAKEHGGIIENKNRSAAWHLKKHVSVLCKEDRIHRIVKGQYILPDDSGG